MTVNVYSLASDGAKAVSTHFKVQEFACKDGSDPVFISPELVQVLENIRTHFGQPVTISSGYRTPTHNKAVGGAANSQHCTGLAADIKVKNHTVTEVAAYAETLLPDSGGIGRYPPKTGRATGWVHIDVRAKKSRWKG